MRVASVRARLVAALVDVAVVILAAAVVVGLGVATAVVYGRVPGDDDEDEANEGEAGADEDVSPPGSPGHDDGLSDPRDRARRIQPETVTGLLKSPVVRSALSGAALGLSISTRNRRSPGFRVVGLRRVDARTGGPRSVRSVLIGMAFDHARREATRPLFRSRAHRGRDERAELAQRLEEVERRYAADRPARQQEVMQVSAAHEGNLLAGCGWQIAGPVLAQVVLGAGAIRSGRTAYDRLTGTIVVSDR